MSSQYLRRVGPEYGLYHETLDDSRTVRHWTGKVIFRIDSRLRVHDGKGGLIGELFSKGTTWHFRPHFKDEVLDTGVQIRDYHWVNLELAEVWVVNHLLSGRAWE